MIAEELNRFDRSLAIMVLLQSRKLVKAQQLSDRFGVSVLIPNRVNYDETGCDCCRRVKIIPAGYIIDISK